MYSFKYELRGTAGDLKAGVIEAPSLAAASDKLRSAGAQIVKLAQMSGPEVFIAKLNSVSLQMGPGLKDVHAFTNQLAVMIKAGISIRSAIEAIAEQIENVRFRKVIVQIKEDVEGGKPFSDALAKHPKIFSPLYINMVRASELSGSFGDMLTRISNYLAQQVETRNMVRGAMIYPGIIATMAITTTVFLLTFVLPKFTALFAGKDALLPMPTQILIALSAFMRNYWYAILGAVGVLAWLFYYAIHTPMGSVVWDKVKLKLPLFKKMLRALYITRGMHTMGELVNAGVPMLETLSITAAVSGNQLYSGLWMGVHSQVKQGQKISQSLLASTLLPKHVSQMISAGEESGKLGDVLRDVAEYYSRELRDTIKAVTAMIEPLMIVLMGVLVGFIAMSIILPIFKMSSLAK